ncbi:hypothetical protein [Methylicorpusculum sp.]|uniref:hypothetical protein n=1 Tax=Methylicorpusculum sp. TaxID=2713644 RepID=UPI00271AE0CC|nr:hypothetical protein [Methylicorpusculum sp.]MDO8842856.1 hypothetical protein [Methylicorpusculum sp.]
MNCTPRVLSPVPCAAYVVVCQPELSLRAGSDEPPLAEPLAKDAATPPTSDALPLPILGTVVPVPVALSGTMELKFHWVMTLAWEPALTKLSANAASNKFEFILGPLSKEKIG